MRVSTAMIRLTSRRSSWSKPEWIRALQEEYDIDWYDPKVRTELHRLREMDVIRVSLRSISMVKDEEI